MQAGVVALTLCLACAAPAHGSAPLPAGWFDLDVPGGAATLDALGLAPEERALALSLLARIASDGLPLAPLATSGDPATVPMPLTHDAWARLLALASGESLFARLMTDRAALYLAAGLSATDDSIRALLLTDDTLLRTLYRHASGFVVVARHLRIRGDRAIVPGGPAADVIWQTLAGAPPSRPADFVAAIAGKDEARLAWYFDTMAGLDDTRLAAAWPEPNRLAAAQALYETFRVSDPQVRMHAMPFRRTIADAWSVVSLTDCAAGGLTGPMWAWLWETLFQERDIDRPRAARMARRETAPVTLAALTRAIVLNLPQERRDRFEMVRLAQRVFPDASIEQAPDLLAALSGYRRYRTLLLALERMGITAPSTWAAMVDTARHLDAHAGGDRHAMAALQGGLALVDRIRHQRTIDAATADRVLRALSEAVLADRRVVGGVQSWITRTLVPALPPLQRPDAWTRATAYESTILQALWGPPAPAPRVIEWEGLSYHLDRAGAERERVRALRALVPSPGLDEAIASGNRADLAAALTALVYVTALGDPDGPASLAADVFTRHDFGLRGTPYDRDFRPWGLPIERQDNGPWHVRGSLLGLDLGLSRLAMRRLSDGQMPHKPTLNLNDLATFTQTMVLMVAGDLEDDDRDELAAALHRGRARVAAAGHDVAALTALSTEARMSAALREAWPWIVARQPETVAAQFALRDLLALGRPRLSPETLCRWGLSGGGLDGRQTTLFPAPAPWEDFAGRTDLGQIATQVPDLTLRLVEDTARLRLPAELVPSLLAFAIDDFWHDVRVRFADDWPQMVRRAAALPATRIEDFVAALAGEGPLRLP